MWADSRFSGAAATRWAQLRAGVWSDATVQKLISATAAQVRVAGSQQRVLSGRGAWTGLPGVQGPTGIGPRSQHVMDMGTHPCSPENLPTASPFPTPDLFVCRHACRSSRQFCEISRATRLCCSSLGTLLQSRSGPLVSTGCSCLLDGQNSKALASRLHAAVWAPQAGQALSTSCSVCALMFRCSPSQRLQTFRAGCSSTWPGWMPPSPRQQARHL